MRTISAFSLLTLVASAAACAAGASSSSRSEDAVSTTAIGALGRTLGADVCGGVTRKVSADGTHIVAIRCLEKSYDVISTEIASGTEKVLASIPVVSDQQLRTSVGGYVQQKRDLFDFEVGTPTNGSLTYQHHFYSLDGSVKRVVDWPQGVTATVSLDGRWAVGATADHVRVVDLASDAAPTDLSLPVAAASALTIAVRASSTAPNELLIAATSKSSAPTEASVVRLVLDPAPALVAIPDLGTVRELVLGYGQDVGAEFANGRFFVSDANKQLVAVDAVSGAKTPLGPYQDNATLVAKDGIFYGSVVDGKQALLHYTPEAGVKRLSAADAAIDVSDYPSLALSTDGKELYYIDRASGCQDSTGRHRGHIDALATDGSGTVRTVRAGVSYAVVTGAKSWVLNVGSFADEPGSAKCQSDASTALVDMATGTELANVKGSDLQVFALYDNVKLNGTESAMFFVSARPSNCAGIPKTSATLVGIASKNGVRYAESCPDFLNTEADSAPVLQTIPGRDEVLVETLPKLYASGAAASVSSMKYVPRGLRLLGLSPAAIEPLEAGAPKDAGDGGATSPTTTSPSGDDTTDDGPSTTTGTKKKTGEGASAQPVASSDGGCSAAPRGKAGAPWLGLAVAFGLCAAARRRRRD